MKQRNEILATAIFNSYLRLSRRCQEDFILGRITLFTQWNIEVRIARKESVLRFSGCRMYTQRIFSKRHIIPGMLFSIKVNTDRVQAFVADGDVIENYFLAVS